MAELELDDIQSGVLRPRPTPYVATYIALRIDDPKAGRALMKRASQVVTSAANPTSPLADTWVSVAAITDKTGPTITANAHYKVNALGVASNVNITSRVNAGFKYFQEFANRSTFQGHSIQFSGSISF